MEHSWQHRQYSTTPLLKTSKIERNGLQLSIPIKNSESQKLRPSELGAKNGGKGSHHSYFPTHTHDKQQLCKSYVSNLHGLVPYIGTQLSSERTQNKYCGQLLLEALWLFADSFKNKTTDINISIWTKILIPTRPIEFHKIAEESFLPFLHAFCNDMLYWWIEDDISQQFSWNY